TSVAFRPDCKHIVIGRDGDKEVKVWNATTGQATLTLKGLTAGVRSVAFSPDGQRIVGGSGNPLNPENPGEIILWDAAMGKPALTLKAHTSMVTSLAFSQDSKFIVSGSWDNTAKLSDSIKC